MTIAHHIEFVYVAGPITLGGEFRNVARAVSEADVLLTNGYIPFVPHLSCFWDLLTPNDYELWLAYDFRWIDRTDAILQIPGQSSGADREVAYARKLGKEVFHGTANDFIAQYGKGPNAPSID